jgi:hypothetical protein
VCIACVDVVLIQPPILDCSISKLRPFLRLEKPILPEVMDCLVTGDTDLSLRVEESVPSNDRRGRHLRLHYTTDWSFDRASPNVTRREKLRELTNDPAEFILDNHIYSFSGLGEGIIRELAPSIIGLLEFLGVNFVPTRRDFVEGEFDLWD